MHKYIVGLQVWSWGCLRKHQQSQVLDPCTANQLVLSAMRVSCTALLLWRERISFRYNENLCNPGFLLRLPSCAPSTQYSSWILFLFLVSFPWFWVSLSSFLLLSPLLEPSLFFFLLSVRSLLGAVAVTPPKKKSQGCFFQCHRVVQC